MPKKSNPKYNQNLKDENRCMALSAASHFTQRCRFAKMKGKEYCFHHIHITDPDCPEAIKKAEQVNKMKETNSMVKSNTSSKEKILQIKGLKHTFEIEQFEAIASYYLATAKMLTYF